MPDWESNLWIAHGEAPVPAGGAASRAEVTALAEDRRAAVGELVRLATSAPLLAVFGVLLTLGGMLTMGRYLAGLPAEIARSGVQEAGDFMAFYTGATMIMAGDGEDLYELKRQQELQAGLRGQRSGGWQPYVNTPLLAVLLAPFSRLTFVQALLVFDAAMVAAMVAALAALRRCVPDLAARNSWWWATVLLIVGYHPIMRTMLGGQNTVLTLFLLTAALAALTAGRPAWAGVLVGLLTYKPQFALLATVLLAARRQWRALGWAGVAGLVHYGLAAMFCGWDWPAAMHSAMKLYQPMERAASYHTHIALLPACDHALAAPWSLLVPAVLIVGVMGVFLRAALAGPLRAPPLPLTWGLMIGATILVSPHLQFYDAGLLVLPAALGLDHLLRNRQRPSTTVRVGLAAGYVLFPVYSAVHWLGFQPLVLWPLLMFFWLAGLCRSAATLRRQNADRSGPGDAAEPDPAPFTGRRPDRSWPGRPWP